MDEYDFLESLRPLNDKNVVKKRSSIGRNTGLSVKINVDFYNAFMMELALMKIKFPFLTESQVQGRTLDKFCIPNLMGKPYKKNKYGAITMCTVHYAIQTAKKSLSERKFHSARPRIEAQRRHTVAGRYFPIDIIIDKSYGGRKSKSSKNLYNKFTLYSDEMEDDDYSIQSSSTDDSGLEEIHPDIQSHTFKLNFNKPSEIIKPVKTYAKGKEPASNANGMSGKGNQNQKQMNLKKSSKNVHSSKIESSVVSVRKTSNTRPKTNRNEEINELTEHLQNIRTTSDDEGDIVENSVDTTDVPPDIDKRQKTLHETIQQNVSANWVSEATENISKTSDFISTNIQSGKRKVSISNISIQEKSNLCSPNKRIKQSISQVSLEYLENTSGCSSSTVDAMDLNSGYLCGVKCLSTPKPHVPLVKVNLSVFSQNNDSINDLQELTNKKRHKISLHPMGRFRKCSESVPYIDEDSVSSSPSEKNSESSESPMSEMDEEDHETHHTPSNYRKRKSSCNSAESYIIMDRNRYSPCIIQLRSSQGTTTESSDEGDNIEVASTHNHATDDFSKPRGNLSSPIAGMQNLLSDGSCVSPSTQNSQQHDQLSQQMEQVTTVAGSRNPENGATNSDGYFLADLFDEYTNQPMRRTLRSSWEQHSAIQEVDNALDVD